MTMRLAGVALAAMVGACALGGGAQAATIIYSGYLALGLGEGNVSFSYDTQSKKASAYYDVTLDRDPVNDPPDYSGAVSGYSTEVSQLSFTPELSDGYFDLSITFNAFYTGSGTYDAMPFNYNSYGPLTFNLSGALEKDPGSSFVYTSQPTGSVEAPFGAFVFGNAYFDLTPVPLPSSLALFGLGLLGLGAAGYVNRRAFPA